MSQTKAKKTDVTIWWRIIFWVATVSAVILACIPRLPVPVEDVSDKSLHFIAFLVLTSLARLSYPKFHTIILLFCLSGLGLGIEVLQSLPGIHRTPEALDFAADMAGVVLTLSCFGTAQSLAKFKQRTRPSLASHEK